MYRPLCMNNHQIQSHPMLPQDINSLTKPELCDLLVVNTRELLELLNHKGSDNTKMLRKKHDVELIQSAIAMKKPEDIHDLATIQ